MVTLSGGAGGTVNPPTAEAGAHPLLADPLPAYLQLLPAWAHPAGPPKAGTA